ncbi:cysteine desulfurase family protein [Deltaproteobacteria bacterium TL4]
MFYLDNAATTPVPSEVLNVSLPYLTEHFANPSSVYDLGMANARAIKASREKLAKVFQVPSEGIVFCSGATESNFLALMSCAQAARLKGKQIIISELEHPSVSNAAIFLQNQGWQIDKVRTLPEGIVDVAHLESLLSTNTRLVSCLAVSNEIGTKQPLEKIGALIKHKNPQALFHVDATQALGKIALPLSSAPIDMFSIGGHKVGAPKGIGALIMTHSLPVVPIMSGGGQEHGWRGGTENVFGIVALSEAILLIEKQREETYRHMLTYKRQWLDFLTSQHPEIRRFESEHVLPFYLNLALTPIPAEVFLHHLEAQQIYVSTGSACSSNKKNKIKSIWPMVGVNSTIANSMIRLSFAKQNLSEDLNQLFQQFSQVVGTLKQIR